MMITDNNDINPNPAGPEAGKATFGSTPVVAGDSLLEIAWQRRWLIMLFVVLSCAGAYVYLLKATPFYSSTSRIYVEQAGPKIISTEDVAAAQSKNYLYTQAELMTSTPIISKAAEHLKGLKAFTDVDNPIAFLKHNIKVNVGKKDDIINVSLELPYPEEAAQIVNEVVGAYIQYHSMQKRTTASEVLKILDAQKTKADKDLDKKLQQKLEFIQEHPAFSFEDSQSNVILQRLQELSSALTQAQLDTLNCKADYETVKLLKNDPAGIRELIKAQQRQGVYISMNDEETQSRRELKQLQESYNQMLEECTPENPSIQRMQKRIARLQEDLREQENKFGIMYIKYVEQRWLTAKQRESELVNSYESQQKLAQQMNAERAKLAILQSEISRSERLCNILDNRIKELNVTENAGALNINILEVARPGEKPVRPQKARIMAMASVLGLMLGCGLALLLNMTDHRLRSLEEITSVMEIPVLGTVPAMRHKGNFIDKAKKVLEDPLSTTAESYKTIRTAVHFGAPDGQARTILITSPSAGEGKSTLTSNLAISMAQTGQKVLLLDCDFRKPIQHKIFGFDHQVGLSNVLTGMSSLEKAVQKSVVENLDVLPCGPVPPNPSEILESRAFADLLQKLADKYDRVILDSPPVMPVADALILGAKCDVVLLVVRAESTMRKAAEQARDGLLSVGANILGVVVNDVQHRKRYGYYYRGYYRYGYGRYYGYGEDEKQTVIAGDIEAAQSRTSSKKRRRSGASRQKQE